MEWRKQPLIPAHLYAAGAQLRVRVRGAGRAAGVPDPRLPGALRPGRLVRVDMRRRLHPRQPRCHGDRGPLAHDPDVPHEQRQ
jgi:hypothetical protein